MSCEAAAHPVPALGVGQFHGLLMNVSANCYRSFWLLNPAGILPSGVASPLTWSPSDRLAATTTFVVLLF
jgi:hypothetical protein